MRERLLHYYERELRYIRRMTGDFAQRYPAIASQLLIEPDKCEDPHVERLIESFAMLTGRVQMRLDDEFPEITEAFLGLLFPHYLAPIPSMTIAQLEPDSDRSEATTGIEIPRHSLLHADPVKGVRCRFRTCYPVSLWPIELIDVKVIPLDQGEPGCPPGTVGAISIRLRTRGTNPFADLELSQLRFFLDGETATACQLYEYLFSKPLGIVLRRPEEKGKRSAGRQSAVFLPPDHIQPVGFAPDEGLLEYKDDSLLGHRLLQEYFCFPDKYLFADIMGLDRGPLAQIGDSLEILVLLDNLPLDLETKLGPENLKLGCTPVINLFPHQAEPINLTHSVSEYQIVPDAHAPTSYEVCAIHSVEAMESGTGSLKTYRPFFSLRHGEDDGDQIPFWQSARRPAIRKDDHGTEVSLMLVDKTGNLLERSPGETLVVQTLCSNRDLPPQLPFKSSRRGDFYIEGQPGVQRIVTLRKPTGSLRMSESSDLYWRLISLMSLNHLSLTSIDESAQYRSASGVYASGPVAFRELLSLLDFVQTAATKQRVAGLTELESRPVMRQIKTDGGRLFARGLEMVLRFDETKYTGSGVFLFASVLERFLGYYTTINSFIQTVVEVQQREGVVKRWPPRSGEIQLI